MTTVSHQFFEPFWEMFSVSWETVMPPLLRITQTYGTMWKHGETEQLAVAAVLLAYFHFTASYEAKISCWGHMLTGSALTACSYKLLYSNGNSTICSLTARGARWYACYWQGHHFHETLTSLHLNIGVIIDRVDTPWNRVRLRIQGIK